MVNNEKADMMYEQYVEGFSLEQVGKMFGVTRQSVYAMFKCRGFEMREKKKLPFLTFNGKKYTLRNNGYYGLTEGKRTMMHRDIWKFYNGNIPIGFDIHHKNHDKTDNSIKNLELIKKDEHARRFATGNNQYKKCKK